DPAVRRRPLVHGARHGWLRAVRLPARVAVVLRGRPLPRRASGTARGRRRQGCREGDREVRHRHRERGAMAEMTQVEVPDIGDFSDVPVIEVLVAEGDSVDVDAPLVTLESDKATMEIPAPVAGTVDKL